MEVNRQQEVRIIQEKLSDILLEFYGEKQNTDISNLADKIKTVERFSLDQNRILCLFSHSEFKVKFISENVAKIFGYSPTEIYNRGLFIFYKMVYWKQLALPIKLNVWGDKFGKASRGMNLTSGNFYFCGFKVKNKEGDFRTLFLKQKILKCSENKRALLSYLEVEDISNIFKHDVFWARFSTKKGKETCTRVFFNNGQKKEYMELLSIRELEILELAAQHKNNVEIGDILGISKNTVERHRKNMIAKVGVYDMTGLIYICRLIKLI